MSYTQTPDTLGAAYRPLVFWWNVNSAEDVERALVRVYAYGSSACEFRKDYIASSGTNFTFEIDVQTIIARTLKPSTTNKSSLFSSLDAFNIDQNTDCQVDYYIDSYLEYRDSSGFIETSGAGETSSTLYGIAATRQQSQALPLTDYYFSSTASPFDFLTLTDSAEVGADDAFHLAFIGKSIDAIRFRFYDEAGSLQTTAIIDAIGFDPSFPSLCTVSCGPVNLLDMTGYSLILGTSMPTDIGQYAYYLVDVGDEDGVAFTPYSNTFRFNLVKRCSWGVRLYWMNPLGGADQYTFEGQVIKRYRHQGQVSEVTLPWNATQNPESQPYHRGILKTDISGDVVLDITQPLDYQTADWLRGLLTSPEVYLETDDGSYLAVAVEPGEVEIDTSNKASVNFKFQVLIEKTFTQDT